MTDDSQRSASLRSRETRQPQNNRLAGKTKTKAPQLGGESGARGYALGATCEGNAITKIVTRNLKRGLGRQTKFKERKTLRKRRRITSEGQGSVLARTKEGHSTVHYSLPFFCVCVRVYSFRIVAPRRSPRTLNKNWFNENENGVLS